MIPIVADLEQQISRLGLNTVKWATLALVVTTLLAFLFKRRGNAIKIPLFILMLLTIIGGTGVLAGSTIYLNQRAESGGPVHWHTDVEFWSCGVELELRDPNGLLSNKIGSASYHEHNDKRIHLEGVVVRKSEDASLRKFMQVTGGYLTNDRIAIPLNEHDGDWFATAENDKLDGDRQDLTKTGLATGDGEWVEESAAGPLLVLRNGERCGDETAEPAEVQAFVYGFDKAAKTYSQRKLTSPMDYTMRDEAIVPPGDCLIVEYDTPKDRTDKLCQQYGVRDKEKCEAFGVKEFDPETCNIREVSGGSE